FAGQRLTGGERGQLAVGVDAAHGVDLVDRVPEDRAGQAAQNHHLAVVRADVVVVANHLVAHQQTHGHRGDQADRQQDPAQLVRLGGRRRLGRGSGPARRGGARRARGGGPARGGGRRGRGLGRAGGRARGARGT